MLVTDDDRADSGGGIVITTGDRGCTGGEEESEVKSNFACLSLTDCKI